MALYCNHCMNIMGEGDTVCPVCGKTNSTEVPAHHLLPGTVLNGKFLVGEALGEGGFGITYIGRDIKLDMRVAIKEFYPNGFVNRSHTVSATINDSPTADRKEFFKKGKDRFLDEARILAKFSGEPGIVDVRDFFEENNTAYIIMEYLDGCDLKSYLKKNGTLTPDDAVRMLYPVMLSLKKVHAQGLIHRDISPDNIMIVSNAVKLLDFGAARNVSAEANKSLSVMLKPGYAPEEQYRSKGNQGPWTDVYAICATLYKCITGVTPDDATQRVFSDEVKTPSAMGINISPVTEYAIMRGMSVHQQDRYQNIDELLNGLQGINTGVSNGGHTVSSNNYFNQNPSEQVKYTQQSAPVVNQPVYNAAPVQTTSVQSAPTAENAPKKAPNKKLIAILGAVAGLVLIAVLAVFFIFPIFDSEDEIDVDADFEETTETSSEDVTDDIDGELTLSDDPWDFTFMIDGEVYELPCHISVFTDNGWELNTYLSSWDDMIAGGDYDIIEFKRDSVSFTAEVYNYSGNAKAIKDCYVGGIEDSQYYSSGIMLSGDISVDSTITEIINVFGTPDERYDYDDYIYLGYWLDSDSNKNYYNSYEFYIYLEQDSSHIEVRNFVKMTDDKTETSQEVPEYLSEYVAPTELGSDIFSGVVSIDGKLYCLPAPVSEFIDDGWTFSSAPGFIVSGASEYVTLKKGDFAIGVTLNNFALYQTVPTNCAVIRISTEMYGDGTRADVVLPGDIGIGSKKDDVKELIGNADYSYSGSTYDEYSFYDYSDGRDFSLDIFIGKESGLIEDISVRSAEWNY